MHRQAATVLAGVTLGLLWLAAAPGSAQDPDDRRIEESLMALNRAKQFHQQKRYDEAIAEYQKSIKLNADDPWTFNYLGLAYTAKGDHKAALKALEKALTLNPELTDIHNNLGVVYDQMGQRQKAYEAWGRVVRDPTYPTLEKTFYNLGQLYLADKSYDLAVMHFQKAVEKKPRFALGYRGLGLVAKATGNAAEAGGHFEKAVEVDPNDQPSLYELALLREQQGKSEEALAFHRRVVDVDRLSVLGKLSSARLSARSPSK